jgi:hypothetical protein
MSMQGKEAEEREDGEEGEERATAASPDSRRRETAQIVENIQQMQQVNNCASPFVPSLCDTAPHGVRSCVGFVHYSVCLGEGAVGVAWKLSIVEGPFFAVVPHDFVNFASCTPLP